MTLPVGCAMTKPVGQPEGQCGYAACNYPFCVDMPVKHVGKFIAQGPAHDGKWWVLDKNKGRYGSVFQAGLTEAEAREIAAQMNGAKT